MTVETLDVDAEWHEWRARGLGGSDVAAVLGLSPWQSPYSLWAEKVGLTGRDRTEATEAQEFGKRAEPMLVAKFQDDNPGLYVLGEQTMCEHPSKPWMRCTIDGYVHDTTTIDTISASPLGVYEGKTTQDPPQEWEQNGVPLYYKTQATWNMLVTGTDRCWFEVLHLAFGRPKFRTYEFELDPLDAAFVEQRCQDFWLGHVVTGIPPAIDGSEATRDALIEAFPDSIPDSGVPASDDLLQLLVQREQWLETEKIAAAEVERIGNEVRLAIGDAELLIGPDGKKVASWKAQDNSRLDVAALRADHPELAETYTNTKTIRVLRFPPKPKEQ